MKRYYIFYLIIIWVATVSISLIWNLHIDKKNRRETLHSGARAFFEQIVLTRAWNAMHKGVYVPVNDVTKSNPYLDDESRDLTTVDGIKLTMINPAYMTRQISEIAEREGGVKFHITSLYPIRPANKATEWEDKALVSFEEGAKEYGEYHIENNNTYYRYMAPLITEKSCLQCHSGQGYREGDIRGGISVTLPIKKLALNIPLWTSHFAAAAVGALIILVFGIRINNFETRLIKAKNQAETASRSKSTFLANMSHEFRTPMNAILGFTDILRNEIDNKSHKKYLSLIYNSGRSLLELINDILDMSKIEAGKLDVEYTAVNIHSILREIEQVFSIKIAEKGIDFFVDIASDLPESLLLDRIRIRQILFNLVGNAVKFTDTGFIRLSATSICDYEEESVCKIIIKVEDTGIGIPSGQIYKVFQPFTQQQGQHQIKYGGSGLGLSISKRLADIMNGSIETESIHGKGSIFSLVLDKVSVASVPDTTENSEEIFDIDFNIFKDISVLIVDDIKENRNLLKEYLRIEGIEILEAENGREAVNIAQSYMPNLIIMDINMPGMTGLEAIKFLKSKAELKKIPIITVTASVNEKEEPKVKEISDSYFKKPIGRNALLKEMTNLLTGNAGGALVDGNSHFDLSDSTPVLSAEIIAGLPELLDIIEKKVWDQWLELSNRLLLKKTRAFSELVISLGEKYRLDMMKIWGDKLLDEVNSFEITKINKTLSLFPLLVKKVRGMIKDEIS